MVVTWLQVLLIYSFILFPCIGSTVGTCMAVGEGTTSILPVWCYILIILDLGFRFTVLDVGCTGDLCQFIPNHSCLAEGAFG